jgi:CheY-like chemotaxis protein
MALNTVAFSKDKKILIVEDDVVNQLVIGKIIENMGINFEIAEHGKEAVAYCKRQSYDLILMDIQMPEMDGIQATKYIRRSEKNASVPIIALTAFALSGDEALFKASGMDDFLPKPIKIESLNNVLSTYLSHKRARESDDKAVGGRAFASVETTAVNPRDTTLKKQANEALSKVNYLNHLFEEKNYLIIEVFAHQLKTYFNELEFEELKILTFKMERAIRREDYEEAHQNLLAIMDIIKIFNDANTREVEDD